MGGVSCLMCNSSLGVLSQLLSCSTEVNSFEFVAVQICLKADERDVYEFFSRAGKVCCNFFLFSKGI